MINPNESTEFKHLEFEAVISFLYCVAHCLDEQYYLCREKHLWQTQSDNTDRIQTECALVGERALSRFGNGGKLAPTNQNQVWENRERAIFEASPPILVYGYKYGHETNTTIILIQNKWSESLGINWKWRQQEDLHAVNLIMKELTKTICTLPAAQVQSKGRLYLQGLRLLSSLYRELWSIPTSCTLWSPNWSTLDPSPPFRMLLDHLTMKQMLLEVCFNV